jgi:hypothetical protein
MTTADTYLELKYPFTEEELKHARRVLLAKYHPDRATDDLKENYTAIAQEINASYANMHPFCVSPARKTIITLNRQHSIPELMYGLFMLIEVPVYIILGLVLNSLDTVSHWMPFIAGTVLLLSTFFFYIAKMKISIRLQLLQVLSFALLFNNLYPTQIFITALVIMISLWIRPKISVF